MRQQLIFHCQLRSSSHASYGLTQVQTHFYLLAPFRRWSPNTRASITLYLKTTTHWFVTKLLGSKSLPVGLVAKLSNRFRTTGTDRNLIGSVEAKLGETFMYTLIIWQKTTFLSQVFPPYYAGCGLGWIIAPPAFSLTHPIHHLFGHTVALCIYWVTSNIWYPPNA